MSAALYDISIEKRASWGKSLVFTNPDGTPYNLSGLTLTGQIRRDFDDALQAVFNTQIVNAASGSAVISLDCTQTSLIDEAPSSYDVFIDRVSGCSDKLLYGSVTISGSETK